MKLAEPDTIILLPNTTLFPPEDVILLPSWTWTVPLISIKPVVGSNNTLPPADVFNWISPSALCNVIVSVPLSKILIDWPKSVVICNSWFVLPKTFCPSMYNDALDKYKCLNGFAAVPKSKEPLPTGTIDPLNVCVPLNVFEPVVANPKLVPWILELTILLLNRAEDKSTAPLTICPPLTTFTLPETAIGK